MGRWHLHRRVMRSTILCARFGTEMIATPTAAGVLGSTNEPTLASRRLQ